MNLSAQEIFSTLTRGLLSFLLIYAMGIHALAENRIDTQRSDAPELSAYGQFVTGVRTEEVTLHNQINWQQLNEDSTLPDTLPRYDRKLVLEVWYPAEPTARGDTTLRATIRDGKTKVKLHGRSVRDAPVLNQQTGFPTVVVSHGYPGNRYLMSHLAENIASKGYVVVAIDHTGSTYSDQADFSSTLFHRPIDQQLVLKKIKQLSQDKHSFLYHFADADNSALIGYSMGGYGAVINAGAKITQQAKSGQLGAPLTLLSEYNKQTLNGEHPKYKTIIAFAPWGMNYQVFSPQTLTTADTAMLFIAGSQDDISGYTNGVRAIWENMVNADRALLTFDNAGHNAGAPMPAPQESFKFDETLGFTVSEHYTDPVWDTVRMNNISQHFVTVWLNKYLKNSSKMDTYLSLIPESNDGVWALSQNGEKTNKHTYWEGFAKQTARGLRFEKRQNKEP